MADPRKANVLVTYMKNGYGSNQSGTTIAEYNEGVTYVDPATDESDTLNITLTNIDLRWANGWLPQKGDKLTAKIIQDNWDTAGRIQSFFCGKFCINDLSFKGPDLTCEIEGVSVPESEAFRSTKRNKTWERVTLMEIGAEIARKYRLLYDYTGGQIRLGTIEQSGESDSSFLKRVCQDYGMALKVYYGKLIIYDKGAFEARNPVVKISAENLQNWSYNTTMVGTYTGATISYTSGEDDTEFTCIVGGGSRMLNLNEKVESMQEAQVKACAKVNAENEKAVTMSVTIMADNRIAAGCTVNITGLFKLSGKYFVDKVTHSVKAEGAYTMDLELHKCQRRITNISRCFISKSAKGATSSVTQNTPAQGTTGTPSAASGGNQSDQVTVNGPVYWSGNGGKCNQCSNMTAYITEVSESRQYPYGISRQEGGTRYGWCAEGSLTRNGG